MGNHGNTSSQYAYIILGFWFTVPSFEFVLTAFTDPGDARAYRRMVDERAAQMATPIYTIMVEVPAADLTLPDAELEAKASAYIDGIIDRADRAGVAIDDFIALCDAIVAYLEDPVRGSAHLN
jgi:hypothetical protein